MIINQLASKEASINQKIMHKKISKDFFSKSKEEVMKNYGLTKAQYKYIHDQGIPKDANGKPLDVWEVDLPDNLEGNANQQKTPVVPASSIPPKNQQHGFGQNVQPFFMPQSVGSQQNQYHLLAQQWMNQAMSFMREVEQRRNSPGYTEEQCKLDIQQSNWYAQMIEQCMNAAAQTQFNQVTTVINYGGSSTCVTAINTPMANRYMTMDLIGKGIDLFGKLAESLETLANATETIAHVIAMFRGRRN